MFEPIFADLHTHTTRSDGRLPPRELVKAAYDAESDYHQQEVYETLEHRFSTSAVRPLLDHLGVKVDYEVQTSELYVMSGFSGVGKGTVSKKLTDVTVKGKPVALIRSVTSRAPRSENENYTFVTKEEFAELAEKHQLLEYTTEFNKNGYGTPVWEVRRALAEGKAPLLEIDRVGLCRLLTEGKMNPAMVKSVFIAAPAADVAKRLYLRGTESEEAILGRLETAIAESNFLQVYDAVIINQDIDLAVQDTVRVFEGASAGYSFDVEAFQIEMREIISTWPQWIANLKRELSPVDDKV